jgi:hypothetical protein
LFVGVWRRVFDESGGRLGLSGACGENVGLASRLPER